VGFLFFFRILFLTPTFVLGQDHAWMTVLMFMSILYFVLFCMPFFIDGSCDSWGFSLWSFLR
jgi:hypothetical protein